MIFNRVLASLQKKGSKMQETTMNAAFVVKSSLRSALKQKPEQVRLSPIDLYFVQRGHLSTTIKRKAFSRRVITTAQ